MIRMMSVWFKIISSLFWTSPKLICFLLLPWTALSATSAANSYVYGTGVSGPVEAFTTYTVNVDARDAMGVNIGLGGDTFVIEIRNKCTVTDNFNCYEDTGAKKPLTNTIFGTMTDLGTGTYTFDYSVIQSGEVSVLVMLMNGGGIYGEWFTNANWSGVPAKKNITADLTFNWAGGEDLLPGIDDHVSAKFYTKLKPPTTDTYTFYLTSDDGSKLTLDGNVEINKLGVVCVCQDTFTATLTGGKYYDLKIEFFEDEQGAILNLRWSSSTISEQSIPSTYFSYPEYVGSAPYQVTTTCPTGYSGTDTSSPTQCAVI